MSQTVHTLPDRSTTCSLLCLVAKPASPECSVPGLLPLEHKRLARAELCLLLESIATLELHRLAGCKPPKATLCSPVHLACEAALLSGSALPPPLDLLPC